MKDKNKIIVNPYQSPCGVLLLGSIGDKLCLCDWRTEKHSARVDNRLKRMWNAEFEEGTSAVIIIRKSKFPQNPKRSVRFSGKRTKRSVQKRKARNTQKAETKVL